MNSDRNPYLASNEGYPQNPGQQTGYAPYPQPGANYDPSNFAFPPPMVPRPNFPKEYNNLGLSSDDEQGGGQWGSFSGLENKEIRRVFIRKVYTILMIQLSITFGIIALFHFIPSIRDYVRSSHGQWLYFTSYVVFFVVYLILVCSKSAARRFPINLILLGILTLAMGYMMGMISAYYKVESVLIAVGITAFVCLGVTLFSFQTKYDFTSCIGVMFVVSLALFAFGIVCIFTYSRILYTIYAAIGAIAFSIFLAIDTQLIMGGKRHELSAEDHIFGSLMLYLDIVYIFMFILQLFGSRE